MLELLWKRLPTSLNPYLGIPDTLELTKPKSLHREPGIELRHSAG